MTQSDTAADDRRAADPSKAFGSGWLDIFRRTLAAAGESNLGLIASGIAFHAFLAFVPLLTAIVLSYGLVAAPDQVARHIAVLAGTMPQDVADLIGGQLENMIQTADSSAGFGLLLALAVALYGATRGAKGIIIALNIVFEVGESRSFLRQMAMAATITLGLIAMFVIASLGISILSFLKDLLPALGGAVYRVLPIAFWLFAAALASLVIALFYRFAPNRPGTRWRWLTPGSVLATIVWVAATVAFAFYVSHFGDYNATYGALGAVIIFLTWLYVSSYILLLGAQLNRVLERQAAREEAARGSPVERE